MQKNTATGSAQRAHRQVQNSTTLSRKYVKRPVKVAPKLSSITKSPMISRFSSQKTSKITKIKKEEPIAAAKLHPIQQAAKTEMRSRALAMQASIPQKMSAKQIKDIEIKKALNAASKNFSSQDDFVKENMPKHHFKMGRIILALSCAAAAVFAIVYFVNLNMPDISLRVAAMQTGIEAKYPGYIPRNYSLSGIVAEDGKITLNFTGESKDMVFKITEEKSSWDSNALLNNYVKSAFPENYSAIKEQGLTIYVSKNEAAWVNSGTVYKLSMESDLLSKKQITSIATSL